MNEIEQAQELLNKIDFALSAFRGDDRFKNKITESEVQFRYDSIEGMLLITRNDVSAMIREWKEISK